LLDSITRQDAEGARTRMRRRLEVIRAHQLMKAVEAPET
jgi:hypothetical protein